MHYEEFYRTKNGRGKLADKQAVIVENSDIIRKLAKVNNIYINIENERYKVLNNLGTQE